MLVTSCGVPGRNSSSCLFAIRPLLRRRAKRLRKPSSRCFFVIVSPFEGSLTPDGRPPATPGKRSVAGGRHLGGGTPAGIQEEPEDQAEDADDHQDEARRVQLDPGQLVLRDGVPEDRSHGDYEQAGSYGHSTGLPSRGGANHSPISSTRSATESTIRAGL